MTDRSADGSDEVGLRCVVLRVAHRSEPVPQRRDGRLWCGCPESGIVEVDGVWVCGACSGVAMAPCVGRPTYSLERRGHVQGSGGSPE